MKRIDWAQAKADYVNHSGLTLDDIAQKYGVLPNTVKARASRENWTAAREAKSQMLLAATTRNAINASAQELATFNERDLAVAKAVRAMAVRKLQQDQSGKQLTCADIRQIASAVESAQRIARLALGATTENTVRGAPAQVSDRLIDEMELESMTDEELAAFQQLVQRLTRPKKPGSDGSVQ